MVEGDVEYELFTIVEIEQSWAEAAWQRVIAKLFDLRKCQTSFAFCGHYLQRFPKSLRNRVAQKLP